MKTTVEIADGLLAEAKRVAASEGTTLRALMEQGLRHELEERRTRSPFKLRPIGFRGRGMNPEFREGGWQTLRDAIYEGRGA